MISSLSRTSYFLYIFTLLSSYFLINQDYKNFFCVHSTFFDIEDIEPRRSSCDIY